MFCCRWSMWFNLSSRSLGYWPSQSYCKHIIFQYREQQLAKWTHVLLGAYSKGRSWGTFTVTENHIKFTLIVSSCFKKTIILNLPIVFAFLLKVNCSCSYFFGKMYILFMVKFMKCLKIKSFFFLRKDNI